MASLHMGAGILRDQPPAGGFAGASEKLVTGAPAIH